MPVKRRKQKRKLSISPLDYEYCLVYLLIGEYGLDSNPNLKSEQAENVRRVWDNDRRLILDFWFQDPSDYEPLEGWFVRTFKPGGPLTRPFGWWEFEAPEPKQAGESDHEYLIRLDLLVREDRAYLRRKEKVSI